MHRKSLHLYLGCIVFSAIGAGCIPVNYYPADSRRNVREETALMIIPGQTTREEVFLLLGEPDQFSSDGSRVVYNWAKVKALVGGTLYATEAVQKSSLIITFNESGVVEQREVKNPNRLPW